MNKTMFITSTLIASLVYGAFDPSTVTVAQQKVLNFLEELAKDAPVDKPLPFNIDDIESLDPAPKPKQHLFTLKAKNDKFDGIVCSGNTMKKTINCTNGGVVIFDHSDTD